MSSPPTHCLPSAVRTVSHMDSLWPPQLWDLPDTAADTDIAGVGDVAAEAAALAAAEAADLGLADRWRGWRGCEVRVQLTDTVRHGRVDLICRDAAVLHDGDAETLVALAAVAVVEGPAPGPASPPAGRERGSGLGVAREWVGSEVRVGLMSSGERRGLLVTAGADYLELTRRGGSVLIGWSSVSWVQRQP